MWRLSLIFFYLFLFNTLAYSQTSDLFRVELTEGHIKIVSPLEYKAELTVAILNKMSVRAIGKILREDGTQVASVSIRENDLQSTPVILKKDERLIFILQSPPMQAVELIVGKGAYEIPPKK